LEIFNPESNFTNNAEQNSQLVDVIRSFAKDTTTSDAPSVVSFSKDVLPIFKNSCTVCHGTLGGWDASSYTAVMESGDNAPVIIAKDLQASLLVQKLLGTQTIGGVMPPGKLLSQKEIGLIVSWVAAGAVDN